MENSMRVRLSDDFFKKERAQTYADWRLSVWRELFQNAIDQGCSDIRIDLTAGDNGNTVLHFADNGPGMTRDVLENVYFAIGATTKTGNQIGGMGRARVLTCFAMDSYQIRSQDYLVRGVGGEYEVDGDLPFTRGCALTIHVDDSNVAQMHEKLMRFLSESRLDARVCLNGTYLARQSTLRGRHVRNLMLDGQLFAKVYVNKSASYPRLIVRVNGVSMFTTRTYAKAQIVVELEPSLSREVLTSNRDGLHWDYRVVLDEFLRELAVDTVSSLRPRFTRHTTVAQGGGMQKVSRPISRPKGTPSLTLVPSVSEPVPPVSETIGAAVRVNDDAAPDIRSVATIHGWLARTFGDIYIFDETESSEMHRAVAAYVPRNWQVRMANGRIFRTGGNNIRLLLMWQTAIAYALEVALEPLELDAVSYAVGFVFADGRMADHRDEDEGHVFSLCPVNKAGKLQYAVSNRKHLKRLMSLAKHEVTHVSVSHHSEDYSSLREEIDMRFDEAECFSRMKKALRALPDLVTGFTENWRDNAQVIRGVA